MEDSWLQSNAAFIVVCPDEKTVFLWLGKECNEADKSEARALAKEVLQKELANKKAEVVVIEENNQSDSAIDDENLAFFCKWLDSSPDKYLSKISQHQRRNNKNENSPLEVKVGER